MTHKVANETSEDCAFLAAEDITVHGARPSARFVVASGDDAPNAMRF
jgi:hypothetical protein